MTPTGPQRPSGGRNRSSAGGGIVPDPLGRVRARLALLVVGVALARAPPAGGDRSRPRRPSAGGDRSRPPRAAAGGDRSGSPAGGDPRARPAPPPVEIVPARLARPRVGIVPGPSAPARPEHSRRQGEREQAAPVGDRIARSPLVAPGRAGVRPTTGRWVARERAGVRPATRRHPAHGGPARAESQAGDARPGMIRSTAARGRRCPRGRPGAPATAIGSHRERGRSMAGRAEGPRGRQVERPGGRRAERAGERRGASPGRRATGLWNGRTARVRRAMAGRGRGWYDSTRR